MFLLSRTSRFPRGQYCFRDALSVHCSFSRPRKNYTSKANALLKPNTTDLSTPQLDTHSRPSSSVPKLVSLIQNAARVVEEQYTVEASSSGETERLVIPSLDDTQIHSLDDQMMTPAMRRAVQTLEAACAQLTATVAKPHHTLINRFMEFSHQSSLNIALIFKIPDVLQAKPGGMHIAEIETRTGLNQHKIGRVLRLLASRHVFREVSKDVFANNRLSIQLLSGTPIHDLGLHFTDEGMKSSVYLSEVLADKEWGHSFSPRETAFNKYTKYPGRIFDYFEHDHPVGNNRGARFSRGMVEWAAATESLSVVHNFPWNDLGSQAIICDVGSGVGAMCLELAKAYPNLKFVLQDLTERLDQAKLEVWPQKYSRALAENRVQFVPIDFFVDAPVSGCDVYYIKHVLHNWSDELATQILSNVRRAMSPHSRILVHEHIMQYACPLPEEAAQAEESISQAAPAPLLPNYGAGRIRQYNLDFEMLIFMNSEVRSLEKFKKLGEAAGLKFVKHWDLGETGLVEYRAS